MRPHIRSLLIKNNTPGLTLVELVIVISVLGILTTVAIPRFTCFTKKAKAKAALSAIKQIQKGCMYSEDGEVFTESNLPAYKIKSGKSNSCTGPELVSAIPDDKTIYPTFHLNKKSNKLSYAFNGKNGANPKDSLKLMCTTSDLPPNESAKFGTSSGLSCREVTSFKTGIGSDSYYLDGRDERTVTLQPISISVGDNSWLVDGVKTTVDNYRSNLCKGGRNCNQWLEDFAKKAVSVINDSEGKFSAEIDSGNPRSLIIYSPTGTVLNDIKTKANTSVNGRNVNSIYNGTNPWAIPSLNTSEADEGKTTTVCDGR